MYRGPGDRKTIPEVEKYIKEKLNRESNNVPNQSLMMDDSALVLVSQDEVNDEDIEMGEEDMFEDEDNEEQIEEINENYVKAIEDYTRKVVNMHSATQDPGMKKAMVAMTKTLKKSMKCTTMTLQNQMHNFGKGGAAARKTRKGRVINPNPPGISTRLAPGRGPAPLGRHLKDRGSQSLQMATAEGPVIIQSDNPPVYQNRRPHNFSHAVDKNLPGVR
jgi:hypothetical protein